MTADEARAMSDARAGETPLHRTIRLVVYPFIEEAVDNGQFRVAIPLFMFTWGTSTDEVIAQLRADGYAIDEVFLYAPDPELRISW